MLFTSATQADDIKINERLIARDFLRVVLSAEFGGKTKIAKSVKKYVKPVKFTVINLAAENRKPQVRRFLEQLKRKIAGLELMVTENPDTANFRIYIVDGDQYADVIKQRLYKDQNIKVQGRCYVRMIARAEGIMHSDAVILSDHSERVFQRCLVEEVLQGLGPIADRANPKYSIFNSRSKKTIFTRHDQIIMNTLYDPRIRPGMSKFEVKKILPNILHDTLARFNNKRP